MKKHYTDYRQAAQSIQSGQVGHCLYRGVIELEVLAVILAYRFGMLAGEKRAWINGTPVIQFACDQLTHAGEDEVRLAGSIGMTQLSLYPQVLPQVLFQLVDIFQAENPAYVGGTPKK